MITRAQQILLKRAQQEAGLPDDEYREAIAQVTALPLCRSSKDPRLTDGHLDALMSYFEAIHFRKRAAGELKGPCKPNAVFRIPGFWAGRNHQGNTSRDRYTEQNLATEIQTLEQQMYSAGKSLHYCQAIKNRCPDLRTYAAALRRTLNSKAPQASRENVPF